MKKKLLILSLLSAAALLSACGKRPVYNDYTGYLTSPAGQAPASTPTPAVNPPAAPAVVPATPGSTVNTGTAPQDFTSVVTIVSTPAPASPAGSAPGSAGGSAPMPTFSPEPTPIPVVSPSPTAAPKVVTITKSPTSETVQEGGSAMFIAYAENYTGIVWITVSPDKQTSYEIGDAVRVFPGLVVSGQGTSVLSLNNIPYAMNGWRIQAYFTGNGGPAYTNGAYLTVTSASAPIITTGPSSSVVVDLSAQYCQNISNQAYDALYNKAIAYGFTVSNMENYSYANMNASFNVTFSNSKYRIVGEFKAAYSSGTGTYGPVRVVVYQNGVEWLSMTLTDRTIDYFYNILYEYRA